MKACRLFFFSSSEPSGQQLAYQISVRTILINLTLSIFKFIAGIAGHSGAMLSDAVHTASDVFTTIIVIIGVAISGRASDEGHPYGHERLECIAAILLAVILFATGMGIGAAGIQKIAGGQTQHSVPGLLPLIAAVVSILTKEGMYWYTRAGARKIHSDALMADAWHHRSDALSSIGSLIGIAGARLGLAILDPLASIVICLFIIKASVSIFKDSMEKLVDKSCDPETIDRIRETILAQTGVICIDDIKTRMFGSKIYIDIEIGADGNQTLRESHTIAEQVHLAIEETYPKVKHCMVHVNPK
ncbi:cation diffusion facilitator family transporter [Anaerolentibacter hominis]|uniref:cation diffusion facilitator family transporter n=1 Tax=Anaerolentibacter hominis TaxID=3079009 RepID=UPI0031B85A55